MAVQESTKEYYNKIASKRSKWLKRNKYYHRFILKEYSKIIPPQSSILELGCGTGNLIGKLKPKKGVGIDIAGEMLEIARKEYLGIRFIQGDVEEIDLGENKFDYIIISGTLGNINNIQVFLSGIKKYCTHNTRIIIDFYNPLWNPIIRLGQKLEVKMPELYKNWLSIDDIDNFLYNSGYQPIKRSYHLLFPKFLPLVSFIFNHFIGKLPFIRRFSINHLVVARPFIPPGRNNELSASVVITCRDEEGNIQGLVERLPQMGANTEIIFVEGHSKDNTVGKIKEMIDKYPEKDIKMLTQKGIGQGDAFRYGFDEAKGDLVMWLEADLTTPPEEAALFWETYITGRGEYINGSRFIYKMQKSAMPLFNFLGNRFFGILFTLLLKQRFTDTLCGFKAISKHNYLQIRKQIDYFGDFDPFGDFELIFGAIKNNLKVAEVPVHYSPREYGESKAYGSSFFSFLKHAGLLLRMSWKAFVKFTLSL
jgi:ubiquinone/menaquinone biosynthesis C-methylase UbiE